MVTVCFYGKVFCFRVRKFGNTSYQEKWLAYAICWRRCQIESLIKFLDKHFFS